MNFPARACALAAVVLGAGTAGFLAYRHLQPASGLLRLAPPAAVSASQSTAAAPAAEASSDPALPAAGGAAPLPRPVPDLVPDLQLPDLKGVKKSLRSFEGRPLIINFWATWCPPCRREIPLLLQLRRQHAAERLEVVGIAVDFQQAVSEYLKTTKIDYPLLVGDQDGLNAVQQFGMEVVLPFSVFAVSDGRIVAIKIGELHADEGEFILNAMHRVDAGTEGLEQAKAAIVQRLQQLSVERAKAAQGQS